MRHTFFIFSKNETAKGGPQLIGRNLTLLTIGSLARKLIC